MRAPARADRCAPVAGRVAAHVVRRVAGAGIRRRPVPGRRCGAALAGGRRGDGRRDPRAHARLRHRTVAGPARQPGRHRPGPAQPAPAHPGAARPPPPRRGRQRPLPPQHRGDGAALRRVRGAGRGRQPQLARPRALGADGLPGGPDRPAGRAAAARPALATPRERSRHRADRPAAPADRGDAGRLPAQHEHLARFPGLPGPGLGGLAGHPAGGAHPALRGVRRGVRVHVPGLRAVGGSQRGGARGPHAHAALPLHGRVLLPDRPPDAERGASLPDDLAGDPVGDHHPAAPGLGQRHALHRDRRDRTDHALQRRRRAGARVLPGGGPRPEPRDVPHRGGDRTAGARDGRTQRLPRGRARDGAAAVPGATGSSSARTAPDG